MYFNSMQLGIFVQWSFLVINKEARIRLNIFGDSEIQNLESGQTRKSGIVPMSRQKKTCEFIPGICCQTGKMTKRFICISSLNFPEMRSLGNF